MDGRREEGYEGRKEAVRLLTGRSRLRLSAVQGTVQGAVPHRAQRSQQLTWERALAGDGDGHAAADGYRAHRGAAAAPAPAPGDGKGLGAGAGRGAGGGQAAVHLAHGGGRAVRAPDACSQGGGAKGACRQPRSAPVAVVHATRVSRAPWVGGVTIQMPPPPTCCGCLQGPCIALHLLHHAVILAHKQQARRVLVVGAAAAAAGAGVPGSGRRGRPAAAARRPRRRRVVLKCKVVAVVVALLALLCQQLLQPGGRGGGGLAAQLARAAAVGPCMCACPTEQGLWCGGALVETGARARRRPQSLACKACRIVSGRLGRAGQGSQARAPRPHARDQGRTSAGRLQGGRRGRGAALGVVGLLRQHRLERGAWRDEAVAHAVFLNLAVERVVPCSAGRAGGVEPPGVRGGGGCMRAPRGGGCAPPHKTPARQRRAPHGSACRSTCCILAAMNAAHGRVSRLCCGRAPSPALTAQASLAAQQPAAHSGSSPRTASARAVGWISGSTGCCSAAGPARGGGGRPTGGGGGGSTWAWAKPQGHPSPCAPPPPRLPARVPASAPPPPVPLVRTRV